YRIDGGSTQLKGVTPDIILPDALNYIKVGEKENKTAMDWSKINSAQYSQDVFVVRNMDEIKSRSHNRTENNPLFVAIDENAKRIKAQNDQKEFSLELNTYRSELQKRKDDNKKFNGLFKEISGLEVANLPVDMKLIERDSASMARNDNFLKNLRKDVYLDEAINVISDLQSNRITLMDKNSGRVKTGKE
ncbi:MAG TPA: carboxy terminal-processing peptidase, partial [Saprospiraceae bacterium]|nr:carboxy terminal-processing peptidase [Saprospiraceae bacterium]